MKKDYFNQNLGKRPTMEQALKNVCGKNIYRHAKNTASFYFVCPPLFLIFSILNMLHCYNSHESQPVQNCPLKYPEWMVPWRWHYTPASVHCCLRWDPAVLNLQVMATSVGDICAEHKPYLAKGLLGGYRTIPKPCTKHKGLHPRSRPLTCLP